MKGGGQEINSKADLSKLKIERESSTGDSSATFGRDRNKGRLRGHPWLVFAVGLTILVLLILHFRESIFSREGPLVDVLVISDEGGAAVIKNVPVLTATGYVMPRVKATIGPRVTGQLVELFVDVGNEVKAGDLLGRLANDDLKAQERQIKAEIESQKAQLEEAQVNLDDLRREYERQTSLFEEGAVSRSSYDVARRNFKVASARVASAEARLDNAYAMLDVVRADIEKTLIRAPFDGTVLRKEAEVGEIVGPGYGGETAGSASSLVTMCDMKSLEVEVDVNEAYISRLKEGMKAVIVLDAAPGRSYSGAIRKIVPTASRQKASVQVKIAFNDLDGRVMPEMGAQVSFLEEGPGNGESRRGIWVPAEVIRRWKGEAAVFALSKGVVEVVPVESGPVTGGRVEILSGLSAGDQVIVGGPEGLKPGQRVRRNEIVE